MTAEPMPPLANVLSEFRATHSSRRTALLQHYIGKPTDSALELHRRALLVTALHEDKLWPPDET